MIGQTNAIEDINSRLPYIPLQYIESTGTQYIDTQVAIGTSNFSNFKMEIDMQALTLTNDFAIMGTGGSTTGNCIYVGVANDNTSNKAWIYGNGITDTYTKFAGDFKRHLFIYDVNNKQYSIDENKITMSLKTPTKSYNLYLFAYNRGGEIRLYGTFKLYEAKFYMNNVLVRDFIPVLDENNIACLYDRVTKTYFYNKGSGSFNAGPVIQ